MAELEKEENYLQNFILIFSLHFRIQIEFKHTFHALYALALCIISELTISTRYSRVYKLGHESVALGAD